MQQVCCRGEKKTQCDTHLIGRPRGAEHVVRLPLAPVPTLATLLRRGVRVRRLRPRRSLVPERAGQAALARLSVATLVPATAADQSENSKYATLKLFA